MIDAVSRLDQIDLVEALKPKTIERYRVQWRVEILPDGTRKVHDYSYLPAEKRPLIEVEVTA